MVSFQEVDKRQLNFTGKSLYQNIPDAQRIITVVYASYDDIYLFNADGLSEEDCVSLVENLIVTIQSGTFIDRSIEKRIGDTFFVY